MTQDEIIEMLRNSGAIVTPIGFVTEPPTLTVVDVMERFAKLVAQHEREAIAQMFDEAPPLVDFAKNEQGGCLICGFTPKLAAEAIRARGQA